MEPVGSNIGHRQRSKKSSLASHSRSNGSNTCEYESSKIEHAGISLRDGEEENVMMTT